MFRFAHLLAFVTLWSLLPATASAALIAYEGFDYAPDGANLLGANGALGFSGAWRAGGFNASISDNFDLDSDPLLFGQLLHSAPTVRTSAVGAISGITRDLAAPLGLSNSTVYLSFLIQPEGTLHGGAFNGFLGLTLESAGEPELYIGKPGGGAIDRWVLENRGGSLQHASTLATQSLKTALLVVKAEFSTVGNDKFTLYVDPTPGAPEPATGVVKNDAAFGAVQGLTIYSTGAMRIDELRVGETFADVTPVPEPGTFVLAAFALLGLAATRFAKHV